MLKNNQGWYTLHIELPRYMGILININLEDDGLITYSIFQLL